MKSFNNTFIGLDCYFFVGYDYFYRNFIIIKKASTGRIKMKSINNQQDNRVFAMQQVIRKLRHDDLIEGHCFMIFDDELPEDQAYYEYPDGRIQVEQLDKNNLDLPLLVIRVLNDEEITALKEKHEVFR